MSKFASLIAKAPKRLIAATLMVASAIIIPAAALGWGPDRPTYTVANPANHNTFNSITNNPHYGDERNFVTIKEASNQNAGGWKDDITVENGKEYLVRMYVHNNANANLNLVAKDVTAKFNIPSYEAKKIQIDGYLTSSNATPNKIWDQAIFHGDSNFKLQFVNGSAKFSNNVFPSGTSIPNSVVSTGALLGYDAMNGNIPGCFQYDGYLTFKVKAVTSDFDIQKTVRIEGAEDKTFKENVAIKPGDKVEYQIAFKNTGGTQLNDVVIKDTLPKGMSYVAGSTYLHTAKNGTRQVADGLTTNGLNIGDYAPGATAYLKFVATLDKNVELECGTNIFKNTVKSTTSVGAKTDTANVTTSKKCDEEQPKKITVCEVSTNKIISIKESEFDASKHSKDLKDCELPHTGPAENIVAIVGLGALIASAAYYIASRRALNQ